LRFVGALLSLGLLACGGTDSDASDTKDTGTALATYRGGQVTLSEVEGQLARARSPACAAARQSLGGGSVEELIPCYEEIAEGIALERLLLAQLKDPEDAARELEAFPQLQRQAFLETALAEWGREIELTDEEVAAYFETHRDQYRRPGSLELWTLFRRNEAGDGPEATFEFLRGLKQRFEAGETFAALAQEHSQSETAQRGGRVGLVREGRLPERLERAAFALADGDVSEPIAVSGGAILLHARNITRPFEPTFEQARQRVEQELRSQKLAERIDELARGVEPPTTATVLEDTELLEALASGDEESFVLDLSGDRITVAEVRGFVGLSAEPVSELTEEQTRALSAWYRSRANRGLLAHSLLETAEGRLRDRAEERLAQVSRAALVDQLLRQELAESPRLSQDTLRDYFRDNQHHYQSPPRFQLQQWTLPFDAQPPLQLKKMEVARERLQAGATSLAAAVDEVGGAVQDLGWKTMVELGDLPNKALQLIAQTSADGFTVPYQQNEALHLLWVQQREEPRALSFEEAEQSVRADYLRRFEEPLFLEMADERLREAQFRFDSEALHRSLEEPASGE
jgi:parvulin-like peptidyl-prolyl isomerase